MNKNFTYAIPIQNPDRRDNETSIYRHPDFVSRNYAETMPYRTIHEMFRKRLQKPNSQLLGVRHYNEKNLLNEFFTWYTTGEVFSRAEAFGSGLQHMNLVENINEWNNRNFRFIGIYSKNNLEYFINDIGCCIYNITIVPIYDTLGEEATQFAFNQTKMKTCICTANHVHNILKNKHENGLFRSLQNLVIIDHEKFDQSLLQKYPNVLRIIPFSEVEKFGLQNKLPWANVQPSDIYAFSYTSGTTGEPKGAMLSHGNICSTVHSSQSKLKLYPNDVHLSYLPMAHVLERILFITFLTYDLKIGIFQGDILKLKDDLRILQPTIFGSVPRLYNKMHDKMHSTFKEKGGCLQWLIRKGTNSKLNNLHKKAKYKHWLYDALIFNKTKKALGGKVRVCVTGSAPISTDVLDFLKVAFQCPILEGYGQTEGNTYEFGTDQNDGISGHVGGPFTQNEYKLVDVPDMNYTNRDVDEHGRPRPRGEIWVRGPNVFPGYYKLDEKNRETITEDGWLRSGDIGQIIQPYNRLQIIDRKKNIFKLSQGEYIAPEKLEDAYKTAHNLINDIYVYGDSLKSCLVAIVQIDQANIQTLASDYGVVGGDLQNNEQLKKALIEDFNRINKQKKFNSLEKVRKIYIETRNWQDLDLITSSFKKKRFNLKEFYQPQINDMYVGLQ